MDGKAPKLIMEIRKSLGLSQTELARLVWPDKDPRNCQTYISRYERGISDPPTSVFFKIQSLLKT